VKIPNLLSIAIASLAISACSSIQVTPQSGPKVIYDHGNALVVGVKKNGDNAGVGMQGLGDYGGGRVAFGLLYHNKTKSTCDFSLANISATNAKGQKLRIYTGEELEKTIAVDRSIGIDSTSARADAVDGQGNILNLRGQSFDRGRVGDITGSRSERPV
jgi:hypothetical protein